MDASVALAKFNVAQAKAKSTRTRTESSRDPTIPPHFCMKNAVLIASGLDDWEDADYWRLAAEQEHATGLKIAEQAQDQGSLGTLQQVREELDRLNEFREQDPAEYMAQGSTPDDEENDHDDEKEDQDDEEEGRDDGGEGQDGEEGRRRDRRASCSSIERAQPPERIIHDYPAKRVSPKKSIRDSLHSFKESHQYIRHWNTNSKLDSLADWWLINGRISMLRLTLHILAKTWPRPVSSLSGLMISGTHTSLLYQHQFLD